MITMKTCLWILLASISLGFCQDPAAVDLEARRQSVETLRSHISMRQKRLDEVVAEIRERGRKTDQKIGDLVKVLSGTKDSQDSKRRVSQVKAEAVGGLKRMIQVYRTERGKIVERLRTDESAPTTALKSDMEAMDKLVEKRAAEIVELVKSMPGGEDVAKYETDSVAYYNNGVTYENSRISEAWRQNRRDKVEADKQRREVRQALEKAIADLGRRKDALAAGLSAGGITGPEKEIHEQDLAYVNALIDHRKSQLMDLTIPSGAPEDTASKSEADDMKRLFADARRDIASDFTKTLSLYHSAADERDKIHDLQQNLAAREKWLSENEPAAKTGE